MEEKKEPAKASAAPAEDSTKKAKKSKAAPVAKKSAAPSGNSDMPAFHFSFGFLAAIFILAAATLCVVQYLNIYQGKRIQIPFLEQVGKF